MWTGTGRVQWKKERFAPNNLNAQKRVKGINQLQGSRQGRGGVPQKQVAIIHVLRNSLFHHPNLDTLNQGGRSNLHK